MFDHLHKMYQRTLLNPFFDLSWAKDGAALALHDSGMGIGDDDDNHSSGSGSSRSSTTSRSSITSMDDGDSSVRIPKPEAKYYPKQFSAKRHTKECLGQFRQHVDTYVGIEDRKLRKVQA